MMYVNTWNTAGCMDGRSCVWLGPLKGELEGDGRSSEREREREREREIVGYGARTCLISGIEAGLDI
jgi:hypothetical protein